eukprot:6185046-Pleurochrysis_carterae.AAC.2
MQNWQELFLQHDQKRCPGNDLGYVVAVMIRVLITSNFAVQSSLGACGLRGGAPADPLDSESGWRASLLISAARHLYQMSTT